MADADVLQLPDKWTQTCYACVHAMFGERGTYCSVFSEMIMSESVAGRDCESFQANDGKTYVRLDT